MRTRAESVTERLRDLAGQALDIETAATFLGVLAGAADRWHHTLLDAVSYRDRDRLAAVKREVAELEGVDAEQLRAAVQAESD